MACPIHLRQQNQPHFLLFSSCQLRQKIFLSALEWISNISVVLSTHVRQTTALGFPCAYGSLRELAITDLGIAGHMFRIFDLGFGTPDLLGTIHVETLRLLWVVSIILLS
jgi:hypothetical protein